MKTTELQALSSLPIDELRACLAQQILEAAGESLPISPAQQRLWFVDQLEPNSATYNIPCVLWLQGRLNVGVLENALRTLWARHESLRVCFIDEDGEPALVGTGKEFELRREDLAHLPPGDRDRAAKDLIDAEVKRPFNLGEGGLFRGTLLRLGEQEHVFIVCMHHIISDEWSMKLFFNELKELYAGQVDGTPVTLPELALQYSDYAAWQWEWLESDECARQLQFWKEHLAGNPPAVNLPTDRPRDSSRRRTGALEIALVPTDLAERLRTLAVGHGATLFMVLLTAFKALLHRYTGQTDIIVGSPMAGRNQVETERLIGYFANTLPLRARISPEMTFEQLLTQVRDAALGAYCNQDVPFDKVVEALQPDRVEAQTPFINALFIYQTDIEFIELPGLDITFLDVTTETAKFDVTLWAAEVVEGLATGVEYDATLFDAATIQRFLSNFGRVLEAATRDPSRKIGDLPLLGQDESTPPAIPCEPAEDPPRWSFLEKWFDKRAERHSRTTTLPA